LESTKSTCVLLTQFVVDFVVAFYVVSKLKNKRTLFYLNVNASFACCRCCGLLISFDYFSSLLYCFVYCVFVWVCQCVNVMLNLKLQYLERAEQNKDVQIS